MHKSGKQERPVWAVIITDILLTAFFLLTFAFFHHVLPAMKQRAQHSTAPVSVTADREEPTAAEPSPKPLQEQAADPTAEAENDTAAPWRIKFADYFTEDIVITDSSYSSPNVAVSIETVSTGEGSGKITYHVADIHVASVDSFRTYVSHGSYTYFDTQEIGDMDADVGSILSVSGDFCTYQQTGFLMRNGEICRNDEAWCDICVLYEDGTMECRAHGKYTNNEVIQRGALHVWNFGPSLLDENGCVREDILVNVSQPVTYPNPRSALGYYEPGHYCFIIVDGRQEGYSAGMTLEALARVFQDLGCVCAYNLDGGGSAVMTFMQERYSRQSNGADRALGDIIYICEPEER